MYKTIKRVRSSIKDLINIQIFGGNKCFKWCLVRYVHLADHNPKRITKAGRIFGDELGFEHIKFSIKIKGIHKIKPNNSIRISVFVYENKEKYPIYLSKKCFKEKHVH